jgi:nickel-dependent lactate racemase
LFIKPIILLWANPLSLPFNRCTMSYFLKYGKSTIPINLPVKAEFLEFKEPAFDITKEKFQQEFNSALPKGQSSFTNIGIVVSDKTRLCGYPEYLSWITEVLLNKGIKNENITFYIAYGTHPRQTENESLNSYGEIYNSYRFVHHDCNDQQTLVAMGTTSRGTPVKLRKDVLESSLLITFGAISHHYFAGYGGGRKLMFPGLADRKAVYKNHSLFLDLKTRRLATDCQPGKMKGNPLAEDLKEIDDFMPPKISIHGILNGKGKVSQLLVGKTYEDFEAACRVHDSYYRSGIEDKFDLVIASSGGYPKDINFIQGHKSVHHAAAFVKDGGKLIILCECIDGIGSNYFMKFLEAGSFENAFVMLEKNYEGNGGTALSMMTKTGRIRIHMLTNLSDMECRALDVTKLKERDIQAIIDNEKGSIAVIQNASLLVK